jgi:ribosomal protein S18 acetylase RimI-like enzyme
MTIETRITEATMADAARVAAFAAQTFTDTFSPSCSAENIAIYCGEKCTAEYFARSMEAGNTVLMQLQGDVLIGYAKVGHLGVPVKNPARDAQEIHRVYVAKEQQGRGHGKALMLHILSLPRVATAHGVYLGVWEHNVKAQSLYTQYGFKPVSHYTFYVGDQADTDLIMLKTR